MYVESSTCNSGQMTRPPKLPWAPLLTHSCSARRAADGGAEKCRTDRLCPSPTLQVLSGTTCLTSLSKGADSTEEQAGCKLSNTAASRAQDGDVCTAPSRKGASRFRVGHGEGCWFSSRTWELHGCREAQHAHCSV